MKRIFFIIFLLITLMLTGEAGRTLINTYNQTYGDPESNGANIWTAFDSTNNMYVWAGSGEQYFVVNTSTTASALPTLVTLHEGPFIQGARGNLTYTLATNKTYILGPFESSRFKQANGTILIDVNSTRGSGFCIGTP